MHYKINNQISELNHFNYQLMTYSSSDIKVTNYERLVSYPQTKKIYKFYVLFFSQN